MHAPELLTKIGNFFFFAGFIVGKSQYLPITPASSLLNGISNGLYLLGYSLTFIATYINSPSTSKVKKWYEVAPFKENHMYSAILGFIASLISIAAPALPVLVIPSAWILFSSNLIWLHGEYQKLHNPKALEYHFSASHKKSYLSYAITLATIAFFVAFSATLALAFPIIALPTTLLIGVLSYGLGILAGGYYIDFTLSTAKRDISKEPSYNKMVGSLGLKNEAKQKKLQHPYHLKSLFKTKITAIEPDNLVYSRSYNRGYNG